EMNIIKCMGQLFVIQRIDETLTGGSYSVTAYAEHISYTLNDRWIFPPVTIAGYHGSTLMASILEQSTDMGGDWQTQYTFTVESDIDAPEEFRDWYEMPDGVTPYEMLVGSNGFIAKLGGELYRDNFTMKINKRMYGAEDKAFELAIGYNLTGIKRTVDLTTFCTYFRAYDVSDGYYETWWAVSYDPSTLPRAYPRNVVRSANFTYDHEEYKEGQLERDGFAFWEQHCAPLITYELSVKDLRHSPDYKYFANNYRFKVGDKGRVWDEHLQAWVEVEITRTEKDGITGDTTKVVIGSQRSFTRPNRYNTIVPVTINADKTLEGFTPLTFNGDGTPLKHCIIYGAEGGVGDDITVYTPPTTSTTHYDTETGTADSETGYYSAGYISVNPEWTYTITAEFEETGGQLVYEILYYTSAGVFISSETASAADDSFTFTTPSTAKLMRVQAASEDVIEKYSMTTFGISITIENYASQTVIKPLTAPLLDGDSIDFTDIPTYNGETVLTVNNTVSPKVKIQYREPIDHDINKTIEDVPPLEFRSNGDNLTNWLIYGNTGGVGSVSPNLFNGELENAKYSNGVKVGTDTGYISTVDMIPCEASTQYSFSAYTTLQFGAYSCYIDRIEYNSNGEYIKTTSASLVVRNNQTNNGKSTFTTSANTAYIRFSLDVTGASSLNLNNVPDFMFYLGSTKKPYEPYGGGLTVNISNGTISQNIVIPLTALLEKGETISLQTSGVDIPTYNGVNTLTVTSDVQPEKVKIQYKEPLT
ncbi:MAG: phage tail protein, partial [Ruminococcus sp.]|nr:phage tail protein [Ruminococcus sp.]